MLMRNLIMNSSEPKKSSSGAAAINRASSDENCEAMMHIACENLPCEALMPRSHKSSARSFLKNFGNFGGATTANNAAAAGPSSSSISYGGS